MACLDVTVQQVLSGITVSARVVSAPGKIDGLAPKDQLCVLAEIVTSNLNVVASAVCTVNGGTETVLYLEIEPTFIWVYPDYERDVNVYSNTDWIIE